MRNVSVDERHFQSLSVLLDGPLDVAENNYLVASLRVQVHQVLAGHEFVWIASGKHLFEMLISQAFLVMLIEL